VWFNLSINAVKNASRRDKENVKIMSAEINLDLGSSIWLPPLFNKTAIAVAWLYSRL
jgi:hypothetical protein